jgi:hypothetical protein
MLLAAPYTIALPGPLEAWPMPWIPSSVSMRKKTQG